MSQLVVTLERHTLKRNHPVLGVIDEELPQYKIHGQLGENKPGLIGYVGTQPNAPINLITPLPVDLQDEVRKQVREQLSTAGTQVSIPPTQEELSKGLGTPTDDIDDVDVDESTDEK